MLFFGLIKPVIRRTLVYSEYLTYQGFIFCNTWPVKVKIVDNVRAEIAWLQYKAAKAEGQYLRV